MYFFLNKEQSLFYTKKLQKSVKLKKNFNLIN